MVVKKAESNGVEKYRAIQHGMNIINPNIIKTILKQENTNYLMT